MAPGDEPIDLRPAVEHVDEGLRQFLGLASVDQLRALLPTTSGTAPTAVATTGTPAAMACNGGNPKPSYTDG